MCRGGVFWSLLGCCDSEARAPRGPAGDPNMPKQGTSFVPKRCLFWYRVLVPLGQLGLKALTSFGAQVGEKVVGYSVVGCSPVVSHVESEAAQQLQGRWDPQQPPIWCQSYCNCIKNVRPLFARFASPPLARAARVLVAFVHYSGRLN